MGRAIRGLGGDAEPITGVKFRSPNFETGGRMGGPADGPSSGKETPNFSADHGQLLENDQGRPPFPNVNFESRG